MANDLVTQRIENMQSEFEKALPEHMTSERFQRIAITTIKSNPELMETFQTVEGQRSIFASLMKAAQDGLIPDGREAALVVFNNKVKENGKPDKWVKQAQYMPMVWGLLRKARNSDEIAAFNEPQIVYEKDNFIYEAGDNERLEHKPEVFKDRGEPIGAYAIARLTNGQLVRAVMKKDDILKRMGVSKSAKSDYGPWKQWAMEMWKKTVMKELCKYLPSSVNLNAAFANDINFRATETHTELTGTEKPKLEDFEEKTVIDVDCEDIIEVADHNAK